MNDWGQQVEKAGLGKSVSDAAGNMETTVGRKRRQVSCVVVSEAYSSQLTLVGSGLPMAGGGKARAVVLGEVKPLLWRTTKTSACAPC